MVSENARVVELVDTRDLKSLDHCDRAGSSPAPGTTPYFEATRWRHSQVAKARACKALIPGSSPGVASIFTSYIYREMAERLNALVLKTSEGNTSGSSNLPLPATTSKISDIFHKHLQLLRGRFERSEFGAAKQTPQRSEDHRAFPATTSKNQIFSINIYNSRDGDLNDQSLMKLYS